MNGLTRGLGLVALTLILTALAPVAPSQASQSAPAEDEVIEVDWTFPPAMRAYWEDLTEQPIDWDDPHSLSDAGLFFEFADTAGIATIEPRHTAGDIGFRLTVPLSALKGTHQVLPLATLLTHTETELRATRYSVIYYPASSESNLTPNPHAERIYLTYRQREIPFEELTAQTQALSQHILDAPPEATSFWMQVKLPERLPDLTVSSSEVLNVWDNGRASLLWMDLSGRTAPNYFEVRATDYDHEQVLIERHRRLIEHHQRYESRANLPVAVALPSVVMLVLLAVGLAALLLANQTRAERGSSAWLPGIVTFLAVLVTLGIGLVVMWLWLWWAFSAHHGGSGYYRISDEWWFYSVAAILLGHLATVPATFWWWRDTVSTKPDVIRETLAGLMLIGVLGYLTLLGVTDIFMPS